MDWIGIAALVTAIGTATAGIMMELRKGRAQKQDPDVEGSGAAICAELRAGREEQGRFNAALAQHLGMLPLAPPLAPQEPERKAGNGRHG